MITYDRPTDFSERTLPALIIVRGFLENDNSNITISLRTSRYYDMTDELRNTVQLALRTTEELKVVLQASIDHAQELRGEEANSVAESHQSLQKTRLVAVVSHATDEENGYEQGCLLIFRPKSYSLSTGDFRVDHAFPVRGEFAISMAQTRHSTIDLIPSESQSALNQSRTELTLTISAGDESEPLTLVTQDVQCLRSLLAECKRLKAEADNHVNPDADSLETYSWINFYNSKHIPTTLLSSAPRDLHIGRQPLHTRLSPASAGLPGDEEADINLIRDEWVRMKATESCSKGMTREAELRIHIGTFNVNGKLPSQDLSTWVRGRSNPELSGEHGAAIMLPPLPSVSPFAVGEVSGDQGEGENGSVQEQTKATDDISVESTSDGSVSTAVASSMSSSTTTLTTDEGGSAAPQNENGGTVNSIRDGNDSEPDLLVFAFQELDLSTEALIYSSRSGREDAWCGAIFAGLGEKAFLYQKLASKQLVGMLLIIIVKRNHRDRFTDVKVCAVGAGIMGIMGNKGATAIRVTYTPPSTPEVASPRPTTLTFVDSHLAAFDEMMDRRNADFHDLSKRLAFDLTTDLSSAASLSSFNPMPASVYESDVLFWMGDLNYRIDISDSDVRSLLNSDLRAQNMKVLLNFDQLKHSVRHGKAFEGFVEHEITHLPTYRFGSGLQTDGLGYDTKRKPAWTDRILHMSAPSISVHQNSYSSHPEITMSDHRPISADFHVSTPLVDAVELQSAIRTCYRLVADMEESNQPAKVKLESSLLEFGPVLFKRTSSKLVNIHNTGVVPCAYRFVALAADGPIHPRWLQIEPMMGLLLPDEKGSITITIYVDNASASLLNFDSGRLEFTLILHTEMGKDHFISLHADYQPTCFGNELSLLVRLPGPIRELKSSKNLLPVEQSINAPREIMRLINWLMTNAIDTDDLFLTAAEDELVADIRECLDTGHDFPFEPDAGGKFDHGTIVAFGETLLQFLDSLKQPVVPASLHATCLQSTDRDEAFELLDVFPSESVNVLISMTAFLHFISQQGSPEPKPKGLKPMAPSKAEVLAAIFSPILLHDDPSSYPPVSPVGKRNFLLFFLS